MLVFVESLQSETFVGEHLIEEKELKDIFLANIDLAKEVTYTLSKCSFAGLWQFISLHFLCCDSFCISNLSAVEGLWRILSDGKEGL